jgi:3-oxoacyl-[acyl-carrier-protein] synthase II
MIADKGDDIVITGIGCITPIGTGVDALWNGAIAGHSAVRTVTRFDPEPFITKIAAEVSDFLPDDYLDTKQIRRFDRFSQLAVAGAQMALRDAALDPSDVAPHRVGVCLGTALGGISYAEQEHYAYIAKGPRGVSPTLALSIFAGAGSCNIAIEFGFTGPATANGDSCASSPIALGNALHYLRRGEADVMIAGGSEAPLSPLAFGAFALIRAMSVRNDDPTTASRPFDRLRDGFVMAEGSALMVLETRRHAEKRGARIYATLASYSLTNDGSHMAAPRADGLSASNAMHLAMERAGIAPEEVVAVSAHGSSTPLNDKTETHAIKIALGDEKAYRTPVFATKALHGHALGATGAFEAAISCLALHHGILPRSINIIEADPECDLDYVADGPRAFEPGPLLSNSFGFGGIDSCIVLKPASG